MKTGSKEEKILQTMRSRLAVSIEVYGQSRNLQLTDLKFFAADPDHPEWQWPVSALATRRSQDGITERPTLVINKLPQHIRQVTNDQRQNRPTGKVIPVDDYSDPEVAEIFNGLIKHIEQNSDADIAYDTACEAQVIHGEGFWRILTDYCDDNTFDQDIFIKQIRNTFSVYIDPMHQDPCGADAGWGLITDDLLHEDYERLYPNAQSVSFLNDLSVGDQSRWISEKTIKIAEYFYIKTETDTLNLYPGNQTAVEGSPEDEMFRTQFVKPVRTRKVEKKQVRWIKTNGYEILEEREWAGKYIPIIRVPGNEFEIDGEVYVSGMVRNAKDAVRMYNYWSSQEAEMLALAPKAPFIGYAGQFDGFERQWKTANVENWPYLEVNTEPDGNGKSLPLPQRSTPPQAQIGLIQAKQGASEDLKATMGQYNASLGMTSNERSAKAILARQREGDVGTYHYGSNLARAVRFSTRQLVDLIPKIYDTQRVARIIGEDDEIRSVETNPDQPEAVRTLRDDQGITIKKIYNLGVGKYDVRVVTGPGYATKRQEALEAMAQLLQANPDLWKVAGDLFAKNMDWPGAEELAKRFSRLIPPELLEKGDDNPALQQAQAQIQQMAMEMEQMMKMLQEVEQSMEARELMIKSFEAQVKAYDAETKRISTIQENMTPEQTQDIVRGTIDAMVASGHLMKGPMANGPIESGFQG